MKLNRKRKALAIAAGVYCILWFLTATWGARDVDRAFDREFGVGVVGLSGDAATAPIQRIDRLANFRDLMDPANQVPDDPGYFRSRSRGFAVAPFVIVDEAAAVVAPLGGFGARRINVWFFGLTKWWAVEAYWAV